MEEIMDASRGLSLRHNGPPTEPRPLIPILLFHTSFQSTHTSLIHLPRLQTLAVPPRFAAGGDNSEKIPGGATVGCLRTHTGAIRGHQDTLSLCIAKQWQHLRNGSKSFLCPGRELLRVTAHQVSVINGSLSSDLRWSVDLIMSCCVKHDRVEPCCSATLLQPGMVPSERNWEHNCDTWLLCPTRVRHFFNQITKCNYFVTTIALIQLI